MESSDDEDTRKPAARPTIDRPVLRDQSPADTVALPVTGELPFLVTHWLSGYSSVGDDQQHARTEDQQAALAKIRNAAADLASAFSVLGAFGSFMRPSLGLVENPMQSSLSQQQQQKNATYTDMKRAWSSCPSDQLHLVLESTQSVSAVVDATVKENTTENLVQASAEILHTVARNNKSGGRTLQDAIVVVDSEGNVDGASDLAKDSSAAVSALQAPVLFIKKAEKKGEADVDPASGSSSEEPALLLCSSVAETSVAAATSMRRYLETRTKCHDEAMHIRSLQRSLQLQQDNLVKIEQERSNLLARNCIHGTAENFEATALAVQLDEIKAAEQNCARVIAQLQRQLPFLQRTHETDSEGLVIACAMASKDFSKSKAVLQNYRDPVGSSRRPTFLNNRILMNLCQRQLGIDRCLGRGIPRAMGRIRAAGATCENRKALLYNRFSHAATINTHLSYPVYCLRFDRTGRYFITGADDYLVKVFCFGGSVVVKKHGLMDPAAYARGAVLVCTLKGHAGVINDIGVSSDNSFLATASEDGDCRVWGLKDGCPVAILRGHTGGANMVSWSTLTPYRLVTTGADGLARTWDVREACLKRYGNMIGKRPEYHLQLNGKDLSLSDDSESIRTTWSEPHADEAVPVPPLPVRENAGSIDAVPAVHEPPIPLPPLPPPAAEVANLAANGNAENADEAAGRFIANDVIDEGVKLVSKLQHGATLDERLGGPGTRTRRSAVKVICIARCPYGGHFATGSDDGICRLWQEEDNAVVESVDAHFERKSTFSPENVFRARANGHVAKDRLLFTLKGHLSAITDLQYSKRGDRILTASQKDGVVRVWSWSADPVTVASSLSLPTQHHDGPVRNMSHILIKLTNPNSSASSEVRKGPRARPNRSPTTTISCDAAVWIHDDTKIVTSQSELVKQSGNEIVAGSQYLFLWDSVNGYCLLGIAGAHTMPCPVVLPHPVIVSVICSAGADGVVKLWDLETGKCFFSHMNTADFGPIEPSERGKRFGYLDGDFSPDGGLSLVLTDDSGRVTVFDSSVSQGMNGSALESSSVVAFPEWMKEQYFSNDYYDLFYDASGYCVERGSEQPPHLAPRGARCSHSGTPFSAQVNETFKGLSGPIPTCESVARWYRQQIRWNANLMQDRRVTIKGNLVRQYDLATTTIVQHGEKSNIQAKRSNVSTLSDTPEANRSRVGSTGGSNQRLSSNFRWGEYNEMDFGDDEQDQESDDEDFELFESRSGARTGRSRGVPDSDSEDLDVDEEDEMEPSRAPLRHARRPAMDTDDESENGIIDEYLGTNNTPSGPFIADYDTHFFKMPNREKGDRVKRLWARRNESTSSYGGRKMYTPQVGDSVVYIPQAHHNTLSKSMETPPWQYWPEEAAWPVVKCCIRNIRYRFPYKHCKDCSSVVAKLTLEVSGIPGLSSDRRYGWPSPSFTTPTRSHVFELSVFENNADNADDFIIPWGLYVSRLRQLECALSGPDHVVEVEAFFGADSVAEDAEYITYRGRVVRYSDNEDAQLSHTSLSGSGFRSVTVIWDDGSDDTDVSPWEVSVQAPSQYVAAPERPKLSDDEKKRVRDALNTVRSIRDVDEFFSRPVHEAYSDYNSRVEVPMDLTFITNRLEADYYATRYSAVADVRLIYSNAAKYNGDNDELAVLASEMLKTFEEQVLSEEELAVFHKFDVPVAGVQTTASFALSDAHQDPPRLPTGTQRRSLRIVQERTSLENLPAPAESFRAQSRQTGRSGRLARRSSSSRPGRARQARSVLEVAQPATAPTLEQLSSLSGQTLRGRSRGSATNSSQQVSVPARDMPHRAARAGLRNSADPNVLSAGGETELPQQAASTRRARRSAAPDEGRTNLTDNVNGRAQRLARRAETEEQNFRSQLAELEGESGSDHRRTRHRQTSVVSSRPTRQRANARTGDATEAAEEQSSSPGRRSSRRIPSLEGNVSAGSRSSPSPLARAIAMADDYSDTDGGEPAPPARRQTSSRIFKKPDDSSFCDSQSEYGSEGGKYPAASSESDEDVSVASSSSESKSRAIATRVARSRPSRTFVARDEEESLTNDLPRKRTRTHIGGGSGEMSRASRARDSRVPASYHDPSSSEFESDVSTDSPAARQTGRKKATGNKRKGLAKSIKKPKKKIKTEVTASMQSLNLAKWPEIAIRNISKVTKGVLKHLRLLDRENIFSIPVVEAYSDLEESYLAQISHPMDFRTIEEERLKVYKSITELQEDLILVFRNCMEYNKPGSELFETASTMMESLADTFQQVCDAQGVRLLHH